jgi:hypothetical protein
MTTELSPTLAECPELVDLFLAYTGPSPNTIGAAFGRAAAAAHAQDPLMVATGTDLALYPGSGEPPAVMGFRMSTRGFKELAGISHLGPALATLARMREAEPDGAWRSGAEALLAAVRRGRAASSEAVWREQIAVDAYAGRERAIGDMVDYSCELSERVLVRALGDGAYLSPENLRRDFLEGPAPDVPVPFNRVMVATFFLAGMDIAHRIIRWCDGYDLAWERTMVLIAGRAGRPTAGVTTDTNSVAGVVQDASRGRLPRHHLLIAPHAPVFAMSDGTNAAEIAALEDDYRRLWCTVVATSELGAVMFDGLPRFEPAPPADERVDTTTRRVSGMPAIAGPDDWHAMTTRLRVVLEDPRQLLSGAVTDYASQQLVQHDNDPTRVVVPGLDGEPYPSAVRG